MRVRVWPGAKVMIMMIVYGDDGEVDGPEEVVLMGPDGIRAYGAHDLVRWCPLKMPNAFDPVVHDGGRTKRER